MGRGHYLILSVTSSTGWTTANFRGTTNINSGADLSVGALPVDQAQAESFGLMRAERDGRSVESAGKAQRCGGWKSMKVDHPSLV